MHYVEIRDLFRRSIELQRKRTVKTAKALPHIESYSFLDLSLHLCEEKNTLLLTEYRPQ